MDEKVLLKDLGARTDHAVLIGVTGPTRTGKSTFVKQFMEQFVLPYITDPYTAERTRDELPQSGSGRTVMTAEPKFVPEEAVEVSPDGVTHLSVRLIDNVGYVVPGVLGTTEDGRERMVTTPWLDRELPMSEAAELGTKKMMTDHATIGIVVTTDGTITDLPADAYKEAEKRAIEDMTATGKPFLVLINSAAPNSEEAKEKAAELRKLYGIRPLTVNCRTMTREVVCEVLSELLRQFPVSEMRFYMPDWIGTLPDDHPLRSELLQALLSEARKVQKVSDTDDAVRAWRELNDVETVRVRDADLGGGTVECELTFPKDLYYRILSEQTGFEVGNDCELLTLLHSLSAVKKSYDKFENALEQVRQTGYGIVEPSAEEMQLEVPQIIRKGGNYAIRLKAAAPSVHLIRTDVQTELSPIIGDEKQSQEIADQLLSDYEENSEKLWQSKLFGKSLYDLVSDGLRDKITQMPQQSRFKMRNVLNKVVNEGANGMICILY